MEVNPNNQSLITFSRNVNLEPFPLEQLPESLILHILELLSYNHSQLQMVACLSKDFRMRVINFGGREKMNLCFKMDQAVDIFQKHFPQVILNKQIFEMTSKEIALAQNREELQSSLLRFKNDFIEALIQFSEEELNDFDAHLVASYGQVESYKNLLRLCKDIIGSTKTTQKLLADYKTVEIKNVNDIAALTSIYQKLTLRGMFENDKGSTPWKRILQLCKVFGHGINTHDWFSMSDKLYHFALELLKEDRYSDSEKFITWNKRLVEAIEEHKELKDPLKLRFKIEKLNKIQNEADKITAYVDLLKPYIKKGMLACESGATNTRWNQLLQSAGIVINLSFEGSILLINELYSSALKLLRSDKIAWVIEEVEEYYHVLPISSGNELHRKIEEKKAEESRELQEEWGCVFFLNAD